MERRKIAINNLLDSIKSLYYCLYNEEFNSFKPRKKEPSGFIILCHTNMVSYNPNKYIKQDDISDLISFMHDEVSLKFKGSILRVSMIDLKNFKTLLWKALNAHRIKDEEIEILVTEVQTKIIERF
jgi:ssRNA-specific RNase YbeY (16S rRNA maturation enzyme)